MLSIPKGVSPKHVEELEEYQKQIRIFIRNHQILRHHYEKSSDNIHRGVLRGQIDLVEKYLLEWNEKQKPVIEKIRDEVKRKALASSKRRLKASNGSNGSRKATPSSSPYMSEAESHDAASPILSLLPGQFSGYVTSYDKFTPEGYLDLKERLRTEAQEEGDFFLPRIERVISNVHRNEFMNNLDLVYPSDLRLMREKADTVNNKRLQYRNLTYIPELSEKKHKIDYNYWRGDYNASPPTLRTRNARVNNNLQTGISTRSSRAASPQPSVLTAPEMAEESKEKGNDDEDVESSTPTSLASKRPERKILSSNSLITRKNTNVLALEKKLKELRETIADFGPRTISTRRERTRRNELLAEELKLSKKFAKLLDKQFK